MKQTLHTQILKHELNKTISENTLDDVLIFLLYMIVVCASVALAKKKRLDNDVLMILRIIICNNSNK